MTAICRDGLIRMWCGDEWEELACHGCPGCTEPADVHNPGCAVWASDADCDCPAQEDAV